MTQQTILLATLCLIALGGLIASAARLLRSRPIWPMRGNLGLSTRNRSVFVRESIALDPKRRLHLVEWQEGHILLLTGGPQDLVLNAGSERGGQP